MFHQRSLAAAVAFALFLTPYRASAQTPTAIVSILSDGDYATARPCIQHCVWYDGGLGRGGNSGFDDVGKALGCGQFPINACYCSSRLASSATSLFSSCISHYCSDATDPLDISTALSLYDRYCSTANAVPAVTTSSESLSSGTSKSTSGASSNTPASSSAASSEATPNASQVSSTGGTDTSAGKTVETSMPASSSGGGLDMTSKIALGVGLGVGIPVLALLCAIVFLLLRRGKHDAPTNVGGIESNPKY